jgi:hypothetical protein
VLREHLHVVALGQQRLARRVQVALAVRRVLQQTGRTGTGTASAGAMCVADSMQYAFNGSPCAGIHRCVVPRGRITKSPVRTGIAPKNVSTVPEPASM